MDHVRRSEVRLMHGYAPPSLPNALRRPEGKVGHLATNALPYKREKRFHELPPRMKLESTPKLAHMRDALAR